MEYFLGLDGGGTKTSTVILDSEGRECGRGAGGPCNIATCDESTLNESILSAVIESRQVAGFPRETEFSAVCAGVAGYTAKQRRAEFHKILGKAIPAAHHRLEPDYVTAWWGATGG